MGHRRGGVGPGWTCDFRAVNQTVALAPAALVVLLSGRGTNLEAIIKACDAGLPAQIAAVISNQADALGLEKAQGAGIHTEVVVHRNFASRAAFDAALRENVDRFAPTLVVLAGFMRILTPGFVDHYAGRIINIHPSLLPEYPGLNTHRRALADGAARHGATVHFVTPALDGGPAIAQASVEILPGDDEERLAARVLAEEHVLLPTVIEWFVTGRLQLVDGSPLLDGKPIDVKQTPFARPSSAS